MNYFTGVLRHKIQPDQDSDKNTIRDGGSAALYTLDTVDRVDLVHTVDMVYTVDTD